MSEDGRHYSAVELLRQGPPKPPPPAPAQALPPPRATPAPEPADRPMPAITTLKERIYAQNRAEDREIDAIGKSLRRFVVFIGGGGIVIGVCGMVAAASLFPLKHTEERYLLIHDSGEITRAVSMKDAPLTFSEVTRESALRHYIEWREGYLPESRDIGQMRTLLMSSADERMRFASDYKQKLPDGSQNPKSPLNRYGNNGGARVSDFRYALHETISATTPPTYVYEVRFTKVETMNGEVHQPQRFVATVQCQFRPDLMANEDQLTVNPTGLQVLAYKSDPEPEAK